MEYGEQSSIMKYSTFKELHPEYDAQTKKLRETGITNSKIGSMGESYVEAELLRRGFSVYRPVRDVDGIDMIASKNGNLSTIQVKTCQQRIKSPRSYMKHKKDRKAEFYTIVYVSISPTLDCEFKVWVIPTYAARHKIKEKLKLSECVEAWDLLERTPNYPF